MTRFKNVFILSTGRCGSTGFARACEQIQNYTAGHETRSKLSGIDRLDYPEYHIESDNRLSWFLGQLDQKYGDDAFYVHLLRDREETANSYNRRWNRHGIMLSFAWGIHMRDPKGLVDCLDYYDTVNANIRLFLKDKPHQMTLWMPDLEQKFPDFCEEIGAECDIRNVLSTWNERHNASATGQSSDSAFKHQAKTAYRRYHKSKRFLENLRTYYKIS